MKGSRFSEEQVIGVLRGGAGLMGATWAALHGGYRGNRFRILTVA